jgi:uncharacterized protein
MATVEIVYVATDKSVVQVTCVLAPGARVIDALNSSGLFLSHPEIQGLPVGIFSKLVTLDRLLKDGDRVEIYRPLVNGPMEKRRQRAKLHK